VVFGAAEEPRRTGADAGRNVAGSGMASMEISEKPPEAAVKEPPIMLSNVISIGGAQIRIAYFSGLWKISADFFQGLEADPERNAPPLRGGGPLERLIPTIALSSSQDETAVLDCPHYE
jgi:hypothetical protein